MVNSHPYELVLIAARVHLFPSRTQKLSSLALTILGGRLPGKISNANTEESSESLALFLYLFQSGGLIQRHDDTWHTWENEYFLI